MTYKPELEAPAERRTKIALHRYLFAFFLIVVFSVGVLLGRSSDQPALSAVFKRAGFNDETVCSPVKNKDANQDLPANVDFRQFWQVWNRIQEKSVKRPVDEVKMYYGALQGLVASLNDPYSVYFTPEIAAQFQEELAGSFSGIGAEVGARDNRIVIIAPLPETPAEKAGLQSGDFIIGIDDMATTGLTVDEAVKRIRGAEGTSVTLMIDRPNTKEPFKVTIKRSRIELKSVTNDWLPDNILRITVTGFGEQTQKQFEEAVRAAQTKGAKGIVLDLRNNPGGFLDTSIDFVSEWLDNDMVVVSERGTQKDTRRDYRSTGQHRLRGIPTIVLVNGGSASASEIVAGALQDYKRATIIGSKTFGKGSVQEYEQMPDGSGLKLTVALWYTPADRSINELGITPDIVMEEEKATVPDTKTPEPETVYGKKDWSKDKMIQRAISFLRTNK